MSDHTETTGLTVTTPEDAKALCEALEHTAQRLPVVIGEETGLLRARRLLDIGALQDEKTGLTKAFLRQFAQFKDNARMIGARAPVESHRLRQRLVTLDRHIGENMNVLEASRAVSEGIIQAVFQIAEKETAGPSAYGKDAALRDSQATGPTAIAYDRHL